MTFVTIVTAFERHAPIFRIPIIGISEQSVYDFGEGWASGWFRMNITEKWGPCIETIPYMAYDAMDILPDNKIATLTTMSTNLFAGQFTAVFTQVENLLLSKKEKIMADVV